MVATPLKEPDSPTKKALYPSQSLLAGVFSFKLMVGTKNQMKENQGFCFNSLTGRLTGK